MEKDAHAALSSSVNKGTSSSLLSAEWAGFLWGSVRPIELSGNWCVFESASNGSRGRERELRATEVHDRVSKVPRDFCPKRRNALCIVELFVSLRM